MATCIITLWSSKNNQNKIAPAAIFCYHLFMKHILITGIPGSGKSTLSRILRDKGFNAIDLEEVPQLFIMVDQETRQPIDNYDNTDLQQVAAADWICDKDALKKLIQSQNQPVNFYCGSSSNIEDLLPLFNEIILLQISEAVMRERLSKRPDTDFGGKPEVQDWVMTWKDWWNNEMIEEGAKVVDADQPLELITSTIIKMYPELAK